MLKKLTLHGFKSFSDRTEISLGSGVTAIVGPNGCGKSNLADALRWVLGEQNPRILRTARQQDLVFAGAETKKAMGSCEVKLLFEGIGEEAETELGRRVSRDGSGEYRLNGKICRYKDIVGTLLGTGLSHTGYAVIGQGVVHELAAGKPEDRRVWIEEASGIAKVRLDKKEMEARLASASAGLLRLDDLAVELAERRERLLGDKEAAKRYLELLATKRELELSIWLCGLLEEGRKASALSRRLQKARTDADELEVKLAATKERLRELGLGKVPLDEAVARLTSREERFALTLSGLLKERDAGQGHQEALGRELVTRSARRDALEAELSRLSQEEARLLGEVEPIEIALGEVSAKIEQAEAETRALESLRRQRGEELVGLRSLLVTVEGDLDQCTRQRDGLGRRIQATREEISEGTGRLGQAKIRMEAAKAELGRVEAGLEDARRRRSALEETQAAAQRDKKTLDGELRHLGDLEKRTGTRFSAARAKRRLLSDLERAFEGYGRGPRAVLDAGAKGVLTGILGSVGQLLSCDAKHIPALSAAVGGSAENIVTQDEGRARAAIAMLKAKKTGRATFLPLHLLRPIQMPLRAQKALSAVPGTVPLLEVVSYSPEIDVCARYLLGRVVLADDLDTGLRFMKESGWATRVVTLSGETIEPGGALSGGDAPRSESLFRRKHEIESLRVEEEEAETGLRDLAAKRQRLDDAFQAKSAIQDAASRDLAQVVTLLSSLGADKAKLEEAVRTYLAESARLVPEIDALGEREIALTSEDGALGLVEEELRERLREAGDKLGQLEEQIRKDLESAAEEETVRGWIREKAAAEEALTAIAQRLHSIRGETVSGGKALLSEEGEILSQKARYDETVSRLGVLGTRIEQMREESEAGKQELEDYRSRSQDLLAQIASCREDLARMELERSSLGPRIEELERELQAAEESYTDTAQFIESEYGVIDQDTLSQRTLTRSVALAKADEIDAAMAQLGAVNLKAEDEYNEVSHRLTLIAEEKEDVMGAIEEIKKAHVVVEKEMERRFKETFQEVQSRFGEIFRDLFGGGEGELTLIPETLGVEVKARPPGSRHVNLNLLSGGERSLCGIALIFAILAVKPSPVIVLDEVDTALDETNVLRFGRFLRKYSGDTQFLVITHQRATMEAADLLYGVTMREPGVSQVFSMRLGDWGAIASEHV